MPSFEKTSWDWDETLWDNDNGMFIEPCWSMFKAQYKEGVNLVITTFRKPAEAVEIKNILAEEGMVVPVWCTSYTSKMDMFIEKFGGLPSFYVTTHYDDNLNTCKELQKAYTGVAPFCVKPVYITSSKWDKPKGIAVMKKYKRY